jgi:outer membrane lipoprotein-sorting protein
LAAPQVPGGTARIEFVNKLIPAGALPHGNGSPLVTGAQGRVWVTADGRFRLELQSEAGDAQIVYDGKKAWVYDSRTNTVYRLAVPRERDSKAPKAKHRHKLPTVAEIQRTLNKVARDVTISGAQPTNTADQPSYTVRVSPKHDGGLVGAAELAWDAARGVPLRAAVYAQGHADPVLELKATEISYGNVSLNDIVKPPPAGAEVVNVRQPQDVDKRHRKPIKGLAAVQARVPFKIAAPAKLVGLPRREAVLLDSHNGKGRGAALVYGKGLGAIVVIQTPAPTAAEKAREARAQRNDDNGNLHEGDGRDDFPTVSIDGVTGHELGTALGTVINYERNRVSYTVFGSVTPAAAEAAARGLQ